MLSFFRKPNYVKEIVPSRKQLTIHKLSIEPYSSEFMLNLSVQPGSEIEMEIVLSDESLFM